MARLEIPDRIGFRLDGNRVLIGRDDACDILLCGAWVDRRHLLLERHPSGWHIIDVSRRGTQLNGAPLVPRRAFPLNEGDRLGVGDITLVFYASEPPPPEPTDTGFFPAHAEPPPPPPFGIDGFVGPSEVMRGLRARLRQLAAEPGPIMIRGEFGTGKTLAASALHRAGPHADGPYLRVWSFMVRPDWLLVDLFGEPDPMLGKGGGTLAIELPEELPAAAQELLWEGMTTGRIRWKGQHLPFDIRVIGTTFRDLDECCANGMMYECLYRQFAGREVHMPALRHRTEEDLRELVDALVSELHPGVGVSSGAMERIVRHDWPNNVRELEEKLAEARPHRGVLEREEVWVETQAGGGVYANLLHELLDRQGTLGRVAQKLGLPLDDFLRWLEENGLAKSLGADGSGAGSRE